jgi:hypothetical protein
MNLIKHLIWAICVMTSVAVIAIEASSYSREEEKQRAFMMKACVDAGGTWIRNWTPSWNCVRPAAVSRS